MTGMNQLHGGAFTGKTIRPRRYIVPSDYKDGFMGLGLSFDSVREDSLALVCII